jgi:hypothetical protein
MAEGNQAEERADDNRVRAGRPLESGILDIQGKGVFCGSMISRVTIANYKSIESADFQARRVNVFIGEPNSGKSNILEAVGIASPRAIENLPGAFRAEQAAEFFLDHDLSRTITVALEPLAHFDFRWRDEHFEAGLRAWNAKEGTPCLISADLRSIAAPPDPMVSGPRRYLYRSLGPKEWSNIAVPQLLTPYGANLPGLLSVNKDLRESIAMLFRSMGFRLEIRPTESRISMTKEVDDVLFSFPFEAISETLRRIVFYKAVLESNKDAVLVLDEPEANTFPFYTKYLAERIALDTSNQFFLSTHNPYVLMSIIEKTPQPELAVYVTRMRNYRTEVQLLTPVQCSEALELGMDLFLNLERFFPV